MKIIGQRKTWVLIVLMPLLIGCEPDRDQRLVEMANQSLTTQARQNERLAEQSRVVAEASRELVAADAQARSEMIAAQAELQTTIQNDRATVDHQRDALERERLEIAHARHRDPIIATALSSFGLLLACLLPLLLAGYILYCVNQPSTDEAVLNELLITELAAEQSKILPVSISAPRLEHHELSTRNLPSAGEA